MKDDKIPTDKINETRTALARQIESVRSSIEQGNRLTNDQMFNLGRYMMDHLLAVGADASW